MKILFLILFESNLGHAAAHGCNKYKKVFLGGVGERDYSVFDVEHWEQRTKEQHKDQMHKIVSADTGQMQNNLESEFGTHFSVLALLSCFDTTKMTVTDPMHNLFLGSAKRLLKMWKELGYLDIANLEKNSGTYRRIYHSAWSWKNSKENSQLFWWV